MNLYDYQERAVSETVARLAKNPILVAPTGAGKTTMGRAIVARLRRKTLWLAHRRELIDQAAEELALFQPGIILAGRTPNPRALVQVASVQTLRYRDMPSDIGLVILDEAHHAPAASYKYLFEKLTCPRVGLTATPFRLDGRGLGDHFGDLVVAATPAELVAKGRLLEPVVFCAPAPDLHSARKTGGDYNLAQLGALVEERMLTGDIVNTWLSRAAGRKTICFATNVAHSKRIVAAFVEAGVPAEHVDGNTPGEERAAILARLASGETTLVSNVQILTEGFNQPALECLILARPTASLCLHLQCLGRVIRQLPGKPAPIVLDHAGNHHEHGTALREIEHSLEGVRRGESAPLELRTCANCYRLFSGLRCPECDAEPVVVERMVKQRNGELVPYSETHEYKSRAWQVFLHEARMLGLQGLNFAKKKYLERFGEWPVIAGEKLIDPKRAKLPEKQAVYEQLLEVARTRGYREGWASHRYKTVFGVWPKGFVQEVKATGAML